MKNQIIEQNCKVYLFKISYIALEKLNVPIYNFLTTNDNQLVFDIIMMEVCKKYLPAFKEGGV